MPSICIVRNCTNRRSAKNGQYGESDISFHSFPHKNEHLCQQWIMSLALGNFKPKKCSKVCSVHFQTTDFVAFSAGKRKLKKDAIPTQIISGKISRIIQPKVPLMRDASTHTDFPVATNRANALAAILNNEGPSSVDHLKLPENKCKRAAEFITCRTEDMDTSMDATVIEIVCSPSLSMDASISETGCNSKTSNLDSTYQPTSEDDTYVDFSDVDTNTDIIDPSEPSYIVFASALLKLFTFCNKCLISEVPRATRCKIVKQLVNGTMLSVVTKCTFGHKVKWSSQPVIQKISDVGIYKLKPVGSWPMTSKEEKSEWEGEFSFGGNSFESDPAVSDIEEGAMENMDT